MTLTVAHVCEVCEEFYKGELSIKKCVSNCKEIVILGCNGNTPPLIYSLSKDGTSCSLLKSCSQLTVTWWWTSLFQVSP